jgi:hypothetical protein
MPETSWTMVQTSIVRRNKQTLLGIVRAARLAGTGDPVAYVTRALSEALPPPPDPKAFTTDDWTIRLQAAINTKQWSPAWGAPPGKRGCLVLTARAGWTTYGKPLILLVGDVGLEPATPAM